MTSLQHPTRPSGGRSRRRFRRSGSGERGAVLVLTAIAMVVLMGFTAVAVDLGQRDQRLAGAQHAIDAATLAAAQYLTTHDGDYAGAATRVKEILRENLGIEVGAWSTCTDAQHLDLTAPDDTTCISFRRITVPTSTSVKHDIRVTLPPLSMDTIFGSVLGLDRIDLSAVASSNGNNCGTSAAGCGPGTTVPDTTTTTTAAPLTHQQYCSGFSGWYYLFLDWVWTECQDMSGGLNRDQVRSDMCTNPTYTYNWLGTPVTDSLSLEERYIWDWDICSAYASASSRTSWLRSYCGGLSTSAIYASWLVWDACTTVDSSLQDWDAYYATTTTTRPSPTTTAASPTTTTGSTLPPTTVPTSVDLSS